MKRFWIGAVVLAGTAAAPVSAMAATTATTQLFLNGKPLATEVAPRIVSGNTLVPIRVIAENLGAKVEWDEPSRQVTITSGPTKMTLTIDKPDVEVGTTTSTLEVAPMIVNGSTLLPLRFVGEQLGVKVTWDDLTRSVFMYKKLSGTAVAAAGGTSAGGASASGASASGTNGAAASGSQAAGADAGTATAGAGSNAGTGSVPAAGQAGSGQAAGGSVQAPGAGGTSTGAGASAPGAPTAATPGGTTATGGKTTGGTTAANSASGGTVLPAGTNQPPKAGGVAHAAEPDGDVQPGVVSAIEFAGDRLTIKTTGVSEKPNMFRLSGPDRLVLDVPNAALGDALKAKLKGTVGEIAVQHPLAQRIRFSNYSSEPSTVRIIIDLKERAALVPADPKTVPAGQLVYDIQQSKYRIVIDAGHGGKDSGAISISKKMEKTFNLAMATKVTELLKKVPGVEVLMTRSDDTFVELDDRVAFANDNDADVFLSIHGNKYTPATTGTETYYYREESLDFANTIHQYVVPATGFADRGVRQEAFRVIKATTMPAVLVEVGYLSNKNDEKSMYDDAFENKVAASLVAAIKDYLNIK